MKYGIRLESFTDRPAWRQMINLFNNDEIIRIKRYISRIDNRLGLLSRHYTFLSFTLNLAVNIRCNSLCFH